MTGASTPSGCCGSRTSWATGPTPRPRLSSSTPTAGASARRGAALPRSSRWSPPRGSTACSDLPPCSARPSPKPPGTRPIARPSADCSRMRPSCEPCWPIWPSRRRRPLRSACGWPRPSMAAIRQSMRFGEALECLGGNGYVEESGMPRLYREAPLNSIWEGAGNIQALDLLRVLAREPEAVSAWRTEIELAKGADQRLDNALGEADAVLAEVATDPNGSAHLARR